MPYIDSTTRSWAAASAEAKAPSRVRVFKHDGGDLSLTDWFCADTETEILTASGWRRYDQVAVGDLVASLNISDGVARWVPIQRMNVFEVADAKMLRIEGKAISALVTTGHRWPVRQRVSKAGCSPGGLAGPHLRPAQPGILGRSQRPLRDHGAQ